MYFIHFLYIIIYLYTVRLLPGDNLTEISIIIPVYNAELFLNESLKSVINQNFKNMEIICVDDGSTDKSLIF